MGREYITTILLLLKYYLHMFQQEEVPVMETNN